MNELRPEAIERIGAPAAKEFRRTYERSGKSVIVTGLVESWPALSRWSPEYFARECGQSRVRAAVMSADEVARDAQAGLRYVEESVAACMRSISGGGDRYLSSAIEDFPAALRADIGTLPYVEGAPWQRSKVWAGSQGMRSPLHRDLAHNLYVQLVGRKHFVLFPPEERSRLYANSLFSKIPNGSRADALSPDYAQFPRLREARGFSCTLAPGEVLYLPSLWWHQTRAETVSMSVNFWWARGPLAGLAWGADLAKRAMGLSR